MREPIKLAVLATAGAAFGFLIVAELCSDDFMLHLIFSQVIYDELAGMAVGLLVGMAVYAVYAAFRWKA